MRYHKIHALMYICGNLGRRGSAILPTQLALLCLIVVPDVYSTNAGLMHSPFCINRPLVFLLSCTCVPCQLEKGKLHGGIKRSLELSPLLVIVFFTALC